MIIQFRKVFSRFGPLLHDIFLTCKLALQTGMGTRDTSGKAFLFLHKNIRCDPLLELFRLTKGHSIFFIQKQVKISLSHPQTLSCLPIYDEAELG